MPWTGVLAGKRRNAVKIDFPGEARMGSDYVVGADYVTLDEGHPVSRAADGTLVAAVSGRLVPEAEVRPAALAWVNSVVVEIDQEADAVTLGISFWPRPSSLLHYGGGSRR